MVFDADKTQVFQPEPPPVEKIETGPFDVDIAQLTEMLNQRIYTVMGDNGHLLENLKVSRMDKAVDEHNAVTWMVTLYDSHKPKSAGGVITLPLGEFLSRRQLTVVER